MIEQVKNHLKNIRGWSTRRKLLLFAVDDYGNIRLHSKKAREVLQTSGVGLQGRFDHLDALDTRTDYEYLFDVLDSFHDQQGRPAIFTTYALPCNTDYDRTIVEQSFVYETLDRTYERLTDLFPESYAGSFVLLQEGIRKNLIRPQFHGREHINVSVFNALLRDGSASLKANLRERSMAGLPLHPQYPGVEYNQAFAFWKTDETDQHRAILLDGLAQFARLYGYPSLTFTPPAQQLHPDLYQFICGQGVTAVDKVRLVSRHLGEGRYVRESNQLGQPINETCVAIVRNCMFEPNDSEIDWINFTLRQVRAAFFWGKPAIISSHRVNFCGHIDPTNRKKGLEALRSLLRRIVGEFPDVEFVAVDELVRIMLSSRKQENI
jgi:hypothetical protein